MRKNLAATAALSCALLLAACSGTDQSDDATAPAAETPAEATSSPTPTVERVETVETCAGYFDGGEHSTDTMVTTWGPKIDGELDDAALLEVTVVRDRISSLLFYANEEITPQLQAIQVPFENALTGTVGSPAAVEEAVAEFRTACEAAGFEF
jgi:hypothetical protein